MRYAVLKFEMLTGLKIDTSTWGVIKSMLYVVAAWISAKLTLIGIDHKLIIGISVLMVLDFITGIWKTIRIKAKPTSKQASDGALKKIILLFLPIVVAFFFWLFGYQTAPIFRGFFFIVGLAEVYSIWQNCYSAAKREKIEEYDSFTAIMKAVGNFIFNGLKKKLEDIEKPK